MGIIVKINALKISIKTEKDDYGFYCNFKSGLNIIRGNNSSGKSTLYNAMIYALGMEEILGGRGSKVLPYALKSYIPEGKTNSPIISSFVALELENKNSKTITLKRSITSDKSDKLIEIIEGKYLTEKSDNYTIQPTYIHDGGSATNSDVGFFRVMEEFIGYELPIIPSTSGSEVKLYLQTLFSAFLVEQKRGWTDYIANIPYFRIKDAKNKVVEYLLGLDVFENDRNRNLINIEAVEINRKWDHERTKARLIEDNKGVSIKGIPPKPVTDFDEKLVSIHKIQGEEEIPLSDYISLVDKQILEIEKKQANKFNDAPKDLVDKMQNASDEVARLNTLLETIISETNVNKSLIKEYKESVIDVESDLEKNKAARKIKKLGADYFLSSANDSCPTCHQVVDDSLLLADTHVQPMSISENIDYLTKQEKMLKNYISGIERLIEKQNRQYRQVGENLVRKKEELIGIKKDMSSVSEISVSDLRNQIRLEDEIKDLMHADANVDELKSQLKLITEQLVENKRKRSKLPKDYLSWSDNKKISLWESTFKRLAKDFGYRSAETKDIEIDRDTYLPILSGLTLREINKDSTKIGTDIKGDSSASDFVRLIWSYLISIYEVSKMKEGNHLGLIAFDEPGQHSMRDTSVNAMFKQLNNLEGLQSIVAASFDENDEVFKAETKGVDFHLIEVGEKLLKKL